MIHVALCFVDLSGTYYKHALVTALSVLSNTGSRLCLHIAHDETLSPEAKQAFTATAAKFEQEIIFHPASDIPAEAVSNLHAKLSKGTLIRLMLPQLLDVDKVIYLDCDIVCNCDVAELYRYDLGDFFFGAVRHGKKQERKRCRWYNVKGGISINAGVLLMNLAKLRRELPNLASELFEIIGKLPIKNGDQEAMSIYFDKNKQAFLFLPPKFNYIAVKGESNSVSAFDKYADVIIHYVNGKPWEIWTNSAIHYWRYYAELFPSEDVLGKMLKLKDYQYDSLFAFLLRSPLLKACLDLLYKMTAKTSRHF